MPIDLETPCASCRHESAVHTHCRPGSDCGLCDCARFRGRPALGTVLRVALRSGRAALAPARTGRPQHV